ncbi:hypothetical protein BPMI_00377c [Candidatus Burkholderia pumila]|uniref:Lipoprotein n=1 Tax=Candidatus Burkholderia pumila TaxID=1090375 RepID=A0ABR5HNA8_9BURK|nr:hypothetical protein BPMI_00377c [Candidatus Burkholderia pumila]
MNRWSIFKKFKGVAPAGAVAAALALGACAPLPQQNADAGAATPASGAQSSAFAKATIAAVGAAPALPSGEQRIVVGTANGYHRALKVTAPSQVCNQNAFADGVRYGYALTWNREISDEMRSAGGKSTRRRFDATAVHSQDDQYKIEWNGKERTNACASDGYLIGRIVGIHLAGVDLRDGKPSS